MKPRGKLPAVPVTAVGCKVEGAGGRRGIISEVIGGEYVVSWEPCDKAGERVQQRTVASGGERVDAARVLQYVGEGVEFGGQVGTVLGFGVNAELFRVGFGVEVRDPGRREEGFRREWWLSVEALAPILSSHSRANARHTSNSGLSPHR